MLIQYSCLLLTLLNYVIAQGNQISGVTLEKITTSRERNQINYPSQDPKEFKLYLNEKNYIHLQLGYLTNDEETRLGNYFKVSKIQFFPCETIFSCLKNPVTYKNPTYKFDQNEIIEDVNWKVKARMISKSDGFIQSVKTNLDNLKKKTVNTTVTIRVNIPKFEVNLQEPEVYYQANFILEERFTNHQIKLSSHRLGYLFKLFKDVNNPVTHDSKDIEPDDHLPAEERDICAICLEFLRMNKHEREELEKESGDDYSKIVFLRKCRHFMHKECLRQNGDKGSNLCPLCRTSYFIDNSKFAQDIDAKFIESDF